MPAIRPTFALGLALAAALTALAAMTAMAAVAAPAAPPAPTTIARLTPAQVVAPGSFGRIPTQLAWSPDGKRLSYLWKEGPQTSLFSFDPATGKSQALLRLAELSGKDAGAAGSPDKQAGGEAAKEPALDEYRWSPRGDALVLVSGGDLWLYSLAESKLRRLTNAPGAQEDPRFSPDGSRLAFVHGADLHLLDLASGRETALTTDGKEEVTLNGRTDWVYGEEIWNREPRGFWWSPDGSRIAFYQFDETPVAAYPIVDYSPKYPKVRWQKYPKAGEPNPRVRVGVLEVASGKTSWMAAAPAGDDVYLARVDWTPDSRGLAIQRLNRAQNRLDLLRCDPRDGRCLPLAAEQSATWVNLGQDLRFLPDGRFLWGAETSGWRRLYLHAADGREIRPVTPEGWAEASLDGLTPGGKAIVTGYATAGLGAADRQVLAVALDGDAPPVTLAGKPGWNEAKAVAPATGAWVASWSDADHPPRLAVMRADDSEAAPLPSALPVIDPALLPHWEMLAIDGPDGVKLPARLLRPAGLAAGRRYPAIVFHYGGPASQEVRNAWAPRAAWHKLMAQRGFAVLTVDNTSSVFFGKRGEDRDYHRMGEGDLAAQLAGVDYLKKLGWVDTARLGLWGWSGGGTTTLLCLFQRPGVFKAGVAGAPVTDWTLYDSIYTERYLGLPKDDPEGYRVSSPLTWAAGLRDRLLFVHGTADDNVHPQNTIVLTAKLVDAQLPFEEAIYPAQKHGFRPDASRHLYERLTEYFERELGGPE